MTAKNHSGNMLQSLMRLLFAVGGIYFSYILHDIVLERIYKSKYTLDGKDAKFTFACTTVFLVSICCWAFATFVNTLVMKKKGSAIPVKEQFHVACLVSMSVIGGSMGLKYLSFHIQALLKSSKVLSVAILSLVKGVEKFSRLQIISALLVTGGIVIFNLSDQKKVSKQGQETSLLGFFFVAISLLADGLVGAKQTEIRKKYNPNPMDFMQNCNKFIALISFTVGIVNCEAFDFYAFATENPLVVKDMLQISFAATLGQCFIFYTVSNFGPFRLALITTTRKFITIIASIMIFQHTMVPEQWICVVVIFFAIGLELYDSQNREKEKANKAVASSKKPEGIKHEANGHTKSHQVDGKIDQQTETSNGEINAPSKKHKKTDNNNTGTEEKSKKNGMHSFTKGKAKQKTE